MVNATGMSLQILPKDPNLKPIYYHAQLAQRRPVPEGLFLDFTFPIENKLKYEQHYTLKVNKNMKRYLFFTLVRFVTSASWRFDQKAITCSRL